MWASSGFSCFFPAVKNMQYGGLTKIKPQVARIVSRSVTQTRLKWLLKMILCYYIIRENMPYKASARAGTRGF